MLRANVGVSRKVSRNYNSTGITVTLDGEIPFPTEDSEGVLAKIKELFDLAHEAVDREIERDQSDAAIARRDEPSEAPATPKTAPPKPRFTGRLKNHFPEGMESPSASPSSGNGNGSPNGHQNGSPAPATNRQIAFLHTTARRLGLGSSQIPDEIEKIVGRHCGPHDLSKAECSKVIEFWTQVTA